MRHIEKGPEPVQWMQYRLNQGPPAPRYEDAPGPALQAVREALLRDQGWLCAYCMKRIRQEKLKRAAGAEAPYSETLEIGEADVQVYLEMATPIADNYCSDALVEREVFETWEASEGAVVLTLSPPEDAFADVPVSLDLWNIRLLDSDGRRVSETHLDVDDIPVTQVWGG